MNEEINHSINSSASDLGCGARPAKPIIPVTTKHLAPHTLGGKRPMIQPGYLRIGEAAKYLSIDRSTLRSWCHQYSIPFYPINNRCTLIKKSDIDSVMDRFKVSGPESAARLVDGRRNGRSRNPCKTQ